MGHPVCCVNRNCSENKGGFHARRFSFVCIAPLSFSLPKKLILISIFQTSLLMLNYRIESFPSCNESISPFSKIRRIDQKQENDYGGN